MEITPENKGKSSMDVLTTLHRRPTSEEALSLEDRHILDSASNLGLPVDLGTMKTISLIHEKALPLIEDLVKKLLKQDESLPDYYPLARDGEIFYDALWALGQANRSTLQKRTHYVKISNAMKYESDPNPWYFNDLGITSDRIEKGPPMIFIDSGFRGSLFDSIAEWVGIPKSQVPSRNFQGYLVSSSITHFQELVFSNSLESLKFIEAMDCPIYTEAGYRNSLNNALCAYIQMMPKFTGRFVKTCEIDGKLDVLPQKNSFVLEGKIKGVTTNDRCFGDNRQQINSLDTPLTWVNSDVVDPVASLLLQRKTLKYFSDPKIHDRVYSGGKIKVR